MDYDVNKVQEQWAIVGSLLDNIAEPRSQQFKELYEQYSDIICTAPASSNVKYHNCFPGGYLDHVIRVTRLAMNMYKLWGDECDLPYTIENVIVVALNHDFGKLGLVGKPYYVKNPSDWHAKQGAIYTVNPELEKMTTPDRSLYILTNVAGIKLSEQEYLGIKLHDGVYDEANKAYLMGSSRVSTSLPTLIHHADHAASLIEKHLQDSRADVEQKLKNIKSKSAPHGQGIDVDKSKLSSIFNG